MSKKSVGRIAWFDLTVPDADSVRDFYKEVVGWASEAVSQGDYDDYNMKQADGTTAAGVCHQRDTNANLPATWMVYITVDDLDTSLAAVKKLGGEVLEVRDKVAFIKDPAGAVCALWEEASE